MLKTIILNIEKFSALKGSQSSRCDLIYIAYNGNKCEIFLVDLKNVSGTTDFGSIVSMIDNFLNNKVSQTKTLIGSLLTELSVRNPKFYGVLVLPDDVISRLWEKYGSAVHIKNKFKNSWITSCNSGSIRDRYFPND